MVSAARPTKMPANERKELEVEQDLDFQRRDWAFERAGWLFMLLVVLAAALGTFGGGPLSGRTAVTPDSSTRVEYQRFERQGAPSSLTIHARRLTANDSSVVVWLANEFVAGVRITEIVPQPTKESSSRERTYYEVALATEADAAEVTVHFTPERAGVRRLDIGSGGAGGGAGQALRLSQFVYP
jgi:hypothetical protein